VPHSKRRNGDNGLLATKEGDNEMGRIIYRIKIEKIKNDLRNNIDWYVAHVDDGHSESIMGFPTLKEAADFISEEILR
jgi:hypothetical protein